MRLTAEQEQTVDDQAHVRGDYTCQFRNSHKHSLLAGERGSRDCTSSSLSLYRVVINP